MRRRSSVLCRANSVKRGVRPPASASSRLSQTECGLEHGRLLELAADAERRDGRFVEPRQVGIVAEDHLARIGARLAGDDIHHRRLAGAVGTDHGAHFARLDRQRQFVERPEPIEGDADPVEIEQAVGVGSSRYLAPCGTQNRAGSGSGSAGAGRARGASSPISPRGRNSVTTMNNAPSAYSHNSGSALVNQVLPKLTSTAPSNRARPACRGRRPPPRSPPRSS